MSFPMGSFSGGQAGSGTGDFLADFLGGAQTYAPDGSNSVVFGDKNSDNKMFQYGLLFVGAVLAWQLTKKIG